MALKFKCTNCGEDIIVKYLKPGEIAKCQLCGAKNKVPETAIPTDEEQVITKAPRKISEELEEKTFDILVRAGTKNILLSAAASKVTPKFINFQGQVVLITLSPPEIHEQHEKAILKALSAFGDRGVFHGADLRQGGRQLGDGIYEGKFEFPDKCCACMESPTRYMIVEIVGAREGRSSGSAKTQWRIPGVNTSNELQRHLNAMFCNRYWYAIPFCDAHGGKSKAVYLKEANRLEFANREYARLFGERNELEGRWYRSIIWALRGVSLFVASMGAMVIIGAILLGVGSLSVSGETVQPSVTTTLLLVAGGALACAAGIFVWSRNRGEKF